MFSSEFCKISKNTFSYRTPLVDASEFSRKFLIRLSNFWNDLSWIFTQKQPHRCVLRKRCSENMRCSPINLLHIFRNLFIERFLSWKFTVFRCSFPYVFYRKCFVKNFAKFIRRRLCRNLFLIYRPAPFNFI